MKKLSYAKNNPGDERPREAHFLTSTVVVQSTLKNGFSLQCQEKEKRESTRFSLHLVISWPNVDPSPTNFTIPSVHNATHSLTIMQWKENH